MLYAVNAEFYENVVTQVVFVGIGVYRNVRYRGVGFNAVFNVSFLFNKCNRAHRRKRDDCDKQSNKQTNVFIFHSNIIIAQ